MKKNQHENTHEIKEINLQFLVISLWKRKVLVLINTSFFTLLSLWNLINITPTYKSSSSFTYTNDESVLGINKYGFNPTTDTILFYKFFTHLSSLENQLKIYSSLFPTDLNNMSAEEIRQQGLSFIKSLEIVKPEMVNKNREFRFPEYYEISLKGPDPETITKYLNSLIKFSDLSTLNEYSTIIKMNIENRLKKLSITRESLIAEAKMKRLASIVRIKERDSELIRNISSSIKSAEKSVKESRLNTIANLYESAKLAKEMGIIENNFNKFEDGVQNGLILKINENQKLPDWYLYGEKALLQRIEMLSNRLNDVRFSSEIVQLNRELYGIKNNSILKSLQNRKDDSPFIENKIGLDIEEAELRLVKVDLSNYTSINLSSKAFVPIAPINENKLKWLIVSCIIALLASILIVLALNAVKPSEDEIIQTK